MAIDAATVRKVARLARIAEPEDLLEPLAKELSSILDWIEQLKSTRRVVMRDTPSLWWFSPAI